MDFQNQLKTHDPHVLAHPPVWLPEYLLSINDERFRYWITHQAKQSAKFALQHLVVHLQEY